MKLALNVIEPLQTKALGQMPVRGARNTRWKARAFLPESMVSRMQGYSQRKQTRVPELVLKFLTLLGIECTVAA